MAKRAGALAAGAFRFELDCGEVVVMHVARGVSRDVAALSPADARKAAAALTRLADEAEAGGRAKPPPQP